MASEVGAALSLLLVAGIYSLALAVAVRRQYLAWQAAWAATMLLWGALWSHAHLVLVPAMAGTVTAQTGTFLACFAIAVATASAVTAVERGPVPRGFRTTPLILGAGVGHAGIPLALLRGGSTAALGVLPGLLRLHHPLL